LFLYIVYTTKWLLTNTYTDGQWEKFDDLTESKD